MPANQIGDAATIIQFITVLLVACIGFITALSFFILKGIKKDNSNLWSKLNENRKRCDTDHDSITEIKRDIKNGGS